MTAKRWKPFDISHIRYQVGNFSEDKEDEVSYVFKNWFILLSLVSKNERKMDGEILRMEDAVSKDSNDDMGEVIKLWELRLEHKVNSFN